MGGGCWGIVTFVAIIAPPKTLFFFFILRSYYTERRLVLDTSSPAKGTTDAPAGLWSVTSSRTTPEEIRQLAAGRGDRGGREGVTPRTGRTGTWLERRRFYFL